MDRGDPIRGGHKARGRELGPDRAEDLYVLPRGRLEPPRKREESALPEAGERRPDSLAREEERLAGRVDPERGKGRRGNVRRLDEVEDPAVPGEEVARPFFPDLDGKRPRPSPREPGEVLADQSHEFPRGLHDRHGRGKVRRGRQHPFRPPEAELEDPRMFKKPVRENGGEITEIRGGRPSAVLRDDSALLAVREQRCLRRDLPRETDAQPRRAVDPRGEDRPEIPRYSEAGCDLPRPRQVPDGSQILVGRELEIRGRDDQEEEDGAQRGRAALPQSPALVRQDEGARHRPEREGKSQESPGRHEHEERERDESAGRRPREGRRVDRAGPQAQERERDRHRAA